MATCTSKSWNSSNWFDKFQFRARRTLLICLAFIWLCAFHGPNNSSAFSSKAYFESCENNLLKNGDFQFNHSDWTNSSNALKGVASSYAIDGNFHLWLLPLTGTGEIHQDIPVGFSSIEFSLMVNAGVENPDGHHFVGLQFLNGAGTVLATESVEINNNLNTSGSLQAYSITGMTPTGTTTVRVFGSSDTGYLRMDNICLTQIEDPFASPPACAFDLGQDQEYCGEAFQLTGPPREECQDSNPNTYIWTRDGKPVGAYQNITVDGFGTYCLTYTDCSDCQSTQCINITECLTGSPAATTQSTFCGSLSWTSCDGNVLSSSNLYTNTAYSTNSSYRPCGIEVDDNCNVTAIDTWHCIDYHLDIPNAYTQYTRTNYSGVGLSALQAARLNWIICNYPFNQSGVAYAVWAITETGGERNAIYNEAVSAITSADGSQNSLVFYKSSVSTIQDMIQWECQSSCNITARAGSDKTICEGESVTLSAAGSNGTSPYSYSWSEGGSSENNITVQAESGSAGGGALIESVQGGYNGSGYVEFYAANGEYSEVTINAPQAGNYSFDVRYAYNTAGIVDMKLVINGTTITNSASFVGTSSGSSWEYQCFGPYYFNAGANTIRFVSNNNIGVDIDEYVLNLSGGSIATSNNLTVSPTTTTTYRVTVTDNKGCTAVDEVQVNVAQSNLNIECESNIDGQWRVENDCAVDVCDDQPVLLSVKPNGLSYQWSGPNGFSSNSEDLNLGTISASEVGNYSVTVTDANGCTANSRIAVSLKDCGPVCNLSINANGGTVCIGERANLSASSSGANGGVTYQWSTGATGSSTTVDATSGSSSYSVTVTDSEGCTATATATVVGEDCCNLSVTASGSDLCEPGSTTLNASSSGANGNVTYQWSTGATGSSTTVNVNSSSSYSVTATDADGCKSIDQVSIAIENISADAGLDKSTCKAGDCFTIGADPVGPSGTNYSWSSGVNGTIKLNGNRTDNGQIQVCPTRTTTYTLTVSNNGCTATDQVTITVGDDINANNDSFAACCGEQISGDVSSNDAGLSNEIYVMVTQPSNGTVTLSSDGSFSYQGSGDCVSDQFTYKVCNDNNPSGCCSEATVQLNILPEPTVSMQVGDPDICAGQKTTISAVAAGGLPGYTYQWDNGLGTSNSIEVMPNTATTYRVTVTDANGCEAVEEINIAPDNCRYDLALIKVLGNGQPSTVTVGDQVLYAIQIANQGEVPSNSYTVTDQIPAGMGYVTSSDGGTHSGGIVTWSNLPNLDPGQTVTIFLTLRVDDATQGDFRNWAEISKDSASDYGTTDEDSTPDANVGNDSSDGFGTDPNDPYTNHNDITLDEPAGDEDDNDYEDIAVEVNYDLALIKTLGEGQTNTVGLGDLVTYTITIANQGNVPSERYDVTDQIPAGMSFVSASDNATESGGIVTWTRLKGLDPDQTKDLSLILRVDDATQGDYRNWAEISKDGSGNYGTTDEDSTPDSNVGNDNAAGFGDDPNDPYTNHNDISLDNPTGDEDDNDYEDISVAVSYDLALVKTLGSGQSTTVGLGDLVTYSITISNQGNVASNTYTVTDLIPAGMGFVSASDFGNENGGVVTWSNLSNLNPGSTKVLSLILKVDDATQSDYRNWAEISSDSASDYGTTDEDSTPDDNLTNDPVDNHNDISLDEPAGDEDDNDYEDIQVEVEYDLALIKTLADGQPTSVTVGDLVTYNITISNQGNVPSNAYSVTDQIPAGMSFVSASDSGNESGGIVTWSNLANLNSGTTKTLALVLRVEDASKGDYRNWAEISNDSASDYGTTDEDSTPDTNVGADNEDGFGTDPNDPYTNHNDITLDEPVGDEDDNDYEDIAVIVNYDLALIKTLADGQSAVVGLGDLVTYTITIANQGNVPSERFDVTDQTPAGMSFVSASDSGVENNGIVTWTRLKGIDPGQTKELTLVLRVDDATQRDYRNWAEISKDGAANYGTTDEDSTPDSNVGNDNTSDLGSDPNDPYTNHNDITLDEPAGDEDDNDYEDILLAINYDLALVKTLGTGQSTSVNIGELVTYHITVSNQGNVPSNAYSVVDQIPTGMSFISASDGGLASGSTVTWSNLSNLNAGDTKTLVLILQVDDAAQSSYRNWAEISSDSADDYGIRDEDSTPDTDPNNDLVDNHNDITLDDLTGDEDDNDYEDIDVIVEYDLALIKTLAANQPSSVTVGEVVNYTISVTNQGNVPSNDYTVIDGIPAGMSFVAASDSGTESGGIVTWSNLPNLNPGDTKQLSITLQMDDATIGEYINRAEISDDSSEDYGTTDEDSTPDSDLNNDPVNNHNDLSLDNPTGDEDDNDIEEIEVGVEYDLALIKTLSSGQNAIVNQGDNVSYDITIANQGNVASLSYDVTDQIPDGMSFVSATDGGSESAGVVTWSDLANIPVGGTKTITLVLQVTDITKGDFRNWAEISDDSAFDYSTSDDDSTPDTNTGNDSDAGTGTDPNDPYTNHNDITLDESPGDEDDNDYEDVQAQVIYDLALIKELAPDQPATVQIGDVVVYNITIANQGNVPSNGYTVTDQIPTGMSLMTTSDNGVASGSIVTWTLPSLDPGETKIINIFLQVDNAISSDFRNWAEISSDSASDYGTTDEDSTPDSNIGNDDAAGFGTDPNDPYTNHNDITLDEPAGDEDDNDYEDIAVEINYDLSLAKALATGQSATVSLGEVVEYTITILNQGNVASNEYEVTDYIPAGMEFVAASDFGTQAGASVTWSKLSSLAPNQSKVLTISLRVIDVSVAPFENFAEISDDSSEDYGVTDEDSTPDTDPNNDSVVETDDPTPDTVPGDEDDSDIEVVEVNINYDLALVKDLAADQSGTVSLGEVVDYTITITNEGNVPSGTYAVADYIPAGMSYVAASDFGAVSGSTVNWSSLANLEPGQTKTLTISLKVEDVKLAPFNNIAEITDDSSETYGVTDGDSTPDTDPNNDPDAEDDQDPEIVDVNVLYDLALVKDLAPDQSATVALGEAVNYSITITNQGNVPSGTYDVADYIPAGMEFLSASDLGVLSGSTVTWSSLSSLAPGETKSLLLILRVTDATQAPFTNFAEITNDSSEDFGVTDTDSTPDTNPSNDPEAEDDSDPAVVDVNVIYDLALIKTLASNQAANVGIGDVVNYNITIANQGNVPSNDFSVVDQIPAGMEFVGASDFGSHSGGIVTWASLENLDPNQTKTLTLALRVIDVTLGDFRNWAEISDDSASDYGVTDEDSTPDSNTGSDGVAGTGTDPNDPFTNHNDIALDNPAGDEDDNDYEDVSADITYDLALIKELATDQATTVNLGDIVNYTITITNEGNVPSNTYSVTDAIPTGMEYVSASDFGTLSGSTVTWATLSSLDPGQTKTLTLSLRIVDAKQAPYINIAEISDDSSEDYGVTDEDSTPDSDPNNDPDSEDDQDPAVIDINVVYDLALIKTLADGQPATVGVGDIITYNITIANQGNVPSNDYTVTDQLPTGLGFIAASDSGTASGTVVTWANLPNLDPGQTKTLTLTAQVKDGLNGDYRNWAEISDDSSEDYGVTDEDSTPDTTTGNDNTDGFGIDPNDPYTNHNDITLDNPTGDEDDNDYEDITLLPVYDLALVKLLTTAPEVAEGDVASYSIVITNQGTVPSNDYVVSDYIPAGMSFVTASDGGTESGGVVTWSSLPSLDPGMIQVLTLELRMEDVNLSTTYRNWAEITDDSSEDYGVTDEDSTPDSDPANDPVTNHNDPAADTVIGDEDDNDYEDVTPIIPPPVYDLALIKTIAPGESTTLGIGDQVTYNITISNQGDVPSNAYSVIDVMPAGMSFVTASDGADHFQQTVQWGDLPSIEPGQTKVLTITLQMDDPTLNSTYRNWAEISEDSSDDYGVKDEDSTPDDNVLDDPVNNHNDPTADSVAGDEDDNDYEDITPVLPPPVYDLSLVKVLSNGQSSELGIGDQVTYSILITNQGDVASNDYSVMDVMPAGMSYVSSSDGGSFTAGTVTWANLPNLDPGQTKVLTITLQMDDPNLGTAYSNFAEITDDSSEDYGVTDEDSTPDNNPSNDPTIDHNDTAADTVTGDEDDSDVEVVTPILPEYDLSLIKTIPSGQATSLAIGDQVTYNITISNQGEVASNDYSVADYIPVGMSYVSSSTGGTESGSVVTWNNLPSIEPGKNMILSITLQMEDPTLSTYRNWAEITDDSAEDYGVTDEDSTPDNDPTNDPAFNHNDPISDTVSGDEDDNDYEDITPILPPPVYDLALIKVLADGQSSSAGIGDQVTYNIIVTNQGDVPSNDYTVVDVIPAGMSYVTASNGGTHSGGMVTWANLANLDPGQTKLLSITLQMEDPTVGGDYRNFAEITDDSSEDYGVTDEDSTPDTNPSNDPTVDHNDPTADTVTGDEDDSDYESITPIIPPPVYDLALIKTLAAGQSPSLAAGDQVTYNITITNQGDVASNDYTVIDQLPAGMSYVSSSNGGTLSGGVVTWSNLPSIEPGKNMVLTITLQMDDTSLSTYRNWAEISDDSSEDYGVTDEDSTPDADVTNDPISNHNDPTKDVVAGDEDDNDYEDVLPVQPLPVYDLALIKTLSAGQTTSVGWGALVSYDITVANQGTVNSLSYDVKDQIPAGMSYISDSSNGTYDAVNNAVTWNSLPALDPGQAIVIQMILRVDDLTKGDFRNWAEIISDSASEYNTTDEDSTPDDNIGNDNAAGIGHDTNAGNGATLNPGEDPNDLYVNHNDISLDNPAGDEDDNDYEDITVIFTYDLALIKTVASGQATALAAGDQVTYNITITNQGDVPSNAYSVADYIPAGMSFVAASDGGTHSGGVITWTGLTNLNPEQAKVLTLTLQMEDTKLTTYRNWAEITDDSSENYGVTDEDSTPDSDPTNDPTVNHNDPTADVVLGDEDDNDYEDITPILPPPVYDLALIKVLANGESGSAGAGDQVTYNIIVTNQGTVASNDYTVADVIPTGMSYVSASNGGTHSGGVVTWANLANLDPGQTKVLSITLQMDDPSLGGTYNNFAEITDDSSEDYGVTDEDSTPDTDTTNDPTVNHNDPTADTVIGDEDDSDFESITPIVPAPVYDLALIKTLASGQPTAIAEGDIVNYNITITNQGEVPSNDYTVIDQLPAGMSFVTASDGGLHSGSIVTWTNLPNIDPGKSKVLTIALRLENASLGTYRNIAEITEDSASDYGTKDEDSTTDSDLTNDFVINHNDPTADEVVGDEDDNDYEEFSPIRPSFKYDLALVKMLADGQSGAVAEGEIVNYNIFISNQGGVPSNDYVVVDLIPAGMDFVAASHGGVESGGIVSWINLPNIDPGQTEVLSLTLQLQDASIGSYRNYAEITDDSSGDYSTTDEDSTPDADPKNDPVVNHNDISADEVAGDEDDSDYEDVTSVQPVPVYDLALIKTIADGQSTSLSIGDVITYSIIVTNQGTVASNDYCVVDILPAGMSFVSASDNGVYKDGLVNWIDLPNLEPGQTNVLTIALRMDDTSYGSYRNFAEISDDSSEDYGVNDEDSTPDGNVNDDLVINHNDSNADIINGDEDDHDYEDITSNPEIIVLLECPSNLTITCNESTDPASLGQASASTNCSSGTASITYEDITTSLNNCGNTGTFVRIWTAIDACGGFNTCEQLITVIDDTPPTLSCAADITIDCAGSTDVSLTGGATASDNCSTRDDITITFNDTDKITSCGNITRTWFATDACGNTSNCIQIITIDDETAPTITCPQDITINCDQTTEPSGTGGLATATDNCTTDISIEYINQGGSIDCEIGGALLREFTATDACGNQASCKQVISVTPVVIQPNCNDFSISVSDNITICSGSTAQLSATGGVSYSWSPASSLDNPTVANPAASPTVTTTYTVVSTRADGCQAQAQVTVSIGTATITATGGKTICTNLNEFAQLSATGGVSYSWAPAIGLDDPFSANPIATPTTTTTYVVTGTDATGCTARAEVTVVANVCGVPVDPCTTFAIIDYPDRSICAGNITQLNASRGISYSWSPTTGLDKPTSANPVANPSATTTYTVTVTNAAGCTATDQITVEVTGEIVVSAGPDITFFASCPGETVTGAQLNATGGIFYEWSPAAGLNSVSIPNPIATPFGPTTYTVTVTDQNGCSSTDQVTVQVATPDCLPDCSNFTIANQPDQKICFGETAQLTASGGVLYFWSPVEGMTDPTLPNQTVRPVGTTTYTVTVTDNQGCTAVDQIRIEVESCPDPFSDIDGDGISDAIELQLGTNPTDPCSNNYTGAELCAFIQANPNSPLATADCDGGGVINGIECGEGKDPTLASDDAIQPNPIGCTGFVIYECPDKRICVGGTAQLVVNGGVSWVWSPAAGLDNPFSAVPEASPTTTTTYTVVATDANGCTASEEVVVTVMTELKVYGGEDQTICSGQVAQLDGQGGVRYQWSPTTGLSNPNIANPTANPSTTTTYTVTVTNPMGCTGTDQVTITAGGNLAANAGLDQTVCAGQSANLRATGGLTYRWSPTTGLSNSTVSNPTATPNSTTTYTVTVTDVNGCTGTDQVTVRVENNITVNAGNDATICSGQNVQLNATGGATYQWSPTTGLSNPSINNPVASPSSTTTYMVTVTDVNGCSDTDQVTVTIRNNITVNAGNDVTVCNGQSTQLNATGGASYQWSPATGLSNPSINNPMASPGSTTVYTVTITDVNGCTGTDQVTVTVGNFVAEACEDKEMCAGETTRLLVSAGTAYQWSPTASLDNPNIPAPNANPSTTTTYTVTVTGPNGCTSVDQVTLYVQTNTSANAGADISECPGVGTQLKATGGMSYEWSPKTGLDNPFSASPFANPSTTTTYTVTVMDFNGCIATDQMVYEVSTDCAPPTNCDQGLIELSETCIEDDNMARICLPFSVADVAANFTLTTSLGTVVSNHGCDFVPIQAYTYAILPSMGGSGTYMIESWTVNGNTYTGEVTNMDELTAWMQSNDPTGNWTNISDSYYILGGTPDGVYGDLIIMHEETWITTNLNPSETGQASGTLVEIDMSGRENDVLTITNNTTGCTDQVTIRTCATSPRCPEDLIEGEYDLTITECSEMAPLCLPFNADNMEDYDILVDGNPYAGILEVCTSVTSFAYTYFSIPDQGAKGPYQITKWTVNNETFNGSFNNLAELLEWMNVMDPKGNWVQDATTLAIRGGAVTNAYGKLELVQTFTRSKAILDINTKTTPNSVQMAFAEGIHAISFYNTLNGCSDEFAVSVGCASNKVPRAAGDIVEIDGEEEAILDITANDRAEEITIEITKAPQYGEAVINSDNTVSYEANEGYCNSKVADHFAYRICNGFGCDEAEVSVLVKCPAMQVVSGFSPNNDGVNDYFMIEGLQNYPANELTIFNRWGTEIFKQKGYDGKWNGTFDGLPLTDGTYFYILTDGEGNTQSGYVQINR